MDDHIAIAEKLIKKANKKLDGWGLIGSKHKDVAKLLDQAANSYKLAKSKYKARETYINLAIHHLKTKTKLEAAATAFVDAAHCYDITSVDEAIDCLEQGVDYLCEIGRLNPATNLL
ncbi:putative NSF attachment protein [Rosa chinensis]|uniref:Putative NSF attachment protein n=1 Tax=Rosa chinensis TaxID=74649 RepID=A0A2P6PWQ7_ROSCH|nr:putative NSF attachment protein [Rosa chinensis]